MLKKLFRRSGSRREEGQVLVLFAAGLVGFLGLVGMSVDVGRLVYTKSDLQKVADAAALAGAQDLPDSTADATTKANEYAANNTSGVTTAVTFTGTETIHVAASKDVNFTFLRVLGIEKATPKAKATARGTKQVVTGYYLESTAPFILWGGSRQNPVAADKNCPFQICVDKDYTFMDTGWMNASGKPNAPDWTASGSNNFKGDINHGDGNPIKQIGDQINVVDSVGGLGSVEVPTPGQRIIIPVVNKATGNSDNRTYTIAAWVMVEVKNGCTKNGCKGTVIGNVKAPKGAVVGGTTAPEPTLQQTKVETRLTE